MLKYPKNHISDVEYFPFDEQTCVVWNFKTFLEKNAKNTKNAIHQLQFGSWTYGPDEVQLRWYGNKRAVELEDYSPSGIWDIMDVPGRMAPDRSRMEFHIVIRRKTLFYTVILIIPTVLMSFLSMLVFYLPAECSEKITLAISILLALVVFLLLVSKILPPTSDTIPLMAKYLLMTFGKFHVFLLDFSQILNLFKL
jgi:nicotinic acetylcholine receptor, invertebrate